MKRLQYLVVSLLVLAFSACQDNTFETPASGEIDANGNVLVRFNTEIPDMAEVNTRAVDPDGYGVNSLWLFCFDQYRHYIGHVQATVSQNTASEDNLSGSFTATIPGSTRVLHFIANLNVNDFEDAPNLGRLDTEVIPQFTTTSGLLSYWGYMKFADESALTSFAGGQGSKVYMFRNQARIRYLREGNGTNLSIKGMAIMNQYSRGTVAPFNKQATDDPYAFASAAAITEPTLCADDEILVAVDPTDVSQFGAGTVGSFVFEHENSTENQMFLIFRINTTGGESEDGNWTGDDQYYKIALVDDEGVQLPILRNHDYIVRFSGIPTTGGYATFADAVAGAAANNVWVSIDQTIPSITDGTSALVVLGETTQIITEKSLGAGGVYQINYTWFDGTGAGIQPEVTWVENSGIAQSNIDNQSQFLGYKLVAKCFPVILRIGHMVGVVITRGPPKLGRYRTSLQHSQLAFQAIDKHVDFLAQARRRGRLSVCLGQHRDVCPFFGISTQLGYQFFQLRIIHLLQGLFYRQRDRRIVNILRSKAKVNELLVVIHPAKGVKLFFQEIFHSLHIVVGHAFNVFDALRICFRKITVNVSQGLKDSLVYTSQLRQRQFAQSDKVLHFHLYAIFHQCKFREIGSQGIRLAPVSTVNGRDCGK